MVVAVFTFNLGSRFAVGVSDESLLGGIAEVYIVFALLRAANWSFLARGRRGWLLAAGVVATVLLGAALLMLPAATPEDSLHPFFVDAVFTSTSALCATCLNVRDPSGQWSTFGQAVILCLVQVGGFATMLFGTMAAMRFARRAARGAAALPANPNPAPTARSLAGPILALMLVAEAVGTCGLFGMFYGTGADDGTTIGAAGALWRSVFHSVSAFCNAGFTLQAGSLTHYHEDWHVLGVIMPLVIVGSLGYPLLRELWAVLRRLAAGLGGGKAVEAGPWLSADARRGLTAAWMLIVFGALVFMLLENLAARKYLVERAAIRDTAYLGEANWPTTPAGQLRESAVQSVCAAARVSTRWTCGKSATPAR